MRTHKYQIGQKLYWVESNRYLKHCSCGQTLGVLQSFPCVLCFGSKKEYLSFYEVNEEPFEVGMIEIDQHETTYYDFYGNPYDEDRCFESYEEALTMALKLSNQKELIL